MDQRVRTTVESYDRIVDPYAERNAEASPHLVGFRDLFAKAVGAGGRVVDLGCGPGRDALALARSALRVTGLDLSSRMLERAAKDQPVLVRADLGQPPFRDGSIDGTWAAATLLHVPSEDVPRTLGAWRLLLRPGGTLALSTSLGSDEGWEVTPHDPSSQPFPSGLRRWFVHHERGPLLAAIAAAGFDVVSASERTSHRRWLQILATAR